LQCNRIHRCHQLFHYQTFLLYINKYPSYVFISFLFTFCNRSVSLPLFLKVYFAILFLKVYFSKSI
jgi:hypothetical protein